MEKRIGIKFLSLLICGIIFSCAFVPQENESNGNGTFEKSNGSELDQKAGYYESILSNNMPYLYGSFYVPNRLTRERLIQEYNEWKSQYVVDAGNGMLRVRRDAGTAYDTVSEGIAYGMLIAVYFNDKATFDGIYKYAKAHFHSKGVMHWKVRADGVDISEFDLPVPHEIVWRNTNTGQVVASNASPSGVCWVKLSFYSRGYTSATDADVDMALALIMAYKLWGTSVNFNYETEAKTLIDNIMKYDMGIGFNNELFVYNGACVNGSWSGIWGGPSGWNPSYFTPAWFKVFKEFTGDTKWDELSAKIYQHIDKILAVNGNTGLLPDWCDTSTTSPKPVFGKFSGSAYNGVSDILVNVLIQTNNGVIITNYLTNEPGKMSYNVYYDGIRVLWRMAVAFSWFGDEKAKNIVLKQHQFFKNKFYTNPQGINNIKDGYSIDGSAWNIANKDALNTSIGGQWTTSPFVSMIATSLLSDYHYDYSVKLFSALVNSKTPYTEQFHYYGNTLRLLSLLYLCGEFPNLLQDTSKIDDSFRSIPRLIQAEKYTVGANVKVVADISAEEGKSVELNGTQGWINFNIEVLTNNLYNFISYGYPSFFGERFTIECKVKTTTGGKIVLTTGESPSAQRVELNILPNGGNWQNIVLGEFSIPIGKNTILLILNGSNMIVDNIKFSRPSTNLLIPGYFRAEDFNTTKDCKINNSLVTGSGGTESAQWADYNVKVIKTGYYNIISKANYYGGWHRVEILKDGVSLGFMAYPTLNTYE
ncbi:MAG: glycosyl hydrolase family 8, partial [Brevinematales bacterium]|nr:glycosyl hydrolase family 8 [Brevinematales bacterium]